MKSNMINGSLYTDESLKDKSSLFSPSIRGDNKKPNTDWNGDTFKPGWK